MIDLILLLLIGMLVFVFVLCSGVVIEKGETEEC